MCDSGRFTVPLFTDLSRWEASVSGEGAMTKNRNLKRRIRDRAPAPAAFEEERPADYLDRIPGSRTGKAYKPLVLEALQLSPGQEVIDVGCGTGVDLNAFAARVGGTGSVTGVDIDADALAKARDALAGGEVRLVRADAASLPFSSGSFDRLHTERVLQHVAGPSAVLREMRRVAREGARAVFAEPDWDTLVVDHPEGGIPQAYRRFVTERVIRNPRIGSELPRLVRGAGFELVEVLPVTATFTDAREADRILGFARVTRRAVAAGYLNEGQADRWLEHLSSGPFFASLTLFVVVARTPNGAVL